MTEPASELLLSNRIIQHAIVCVASVHRTAVLVAERNTNALDSLCHLLDSDCYATCQTLWCHFRLPHSNLVLQLVMPRVMV